MSANYKKIVFVIALITLQVSAATIAFYDFRLGDYNWNYVTNNRSISDFEFGINGMSFTIIGEDPYVWGPAENYPDGEPVDLFLCLRSTAGSDGQIFYGQSFTAENSIGFHIINDGKWHDYKLELPPLGTNAKIRIDPGNITTGEITVAWVQTRAYSTNHTKIVWDFTTGLHGWSGNSYITGPTITTDGWSFFSTGEDPQLLAPVSDYLANKPISFIIDMKSEVNAPGKFYYAPDGTGYSEKYSTTFTIIPDGLFHKYYVQISSLGPNYKLRFDPGSTTGKITVREIRAETISVTLPVFNKPDHPSAENSQQLTITSGDITLTHYGKIWGNFVVDVAGEELASAHNSGEIGFGINDIYDFVSLTNANFSVTNQNDTLIETATFTDSGGANWSLTRQFTTGEISGTINVQMSVSCDQNRDVLHIPWLTLFPGLETFGEHKEQGIFAGLEYLADEPSSSKKDISTSEYLCRIPKPSKITFPLMAICQSNRYLAVMWDLSDYVAAVYDSPDRIFHSDSQIMALWAPNAGTIRGENYMTATSPFLLAAGSPLEASFVLNGGTGNTVIPAVKNYVSLFGLPPQPDFTGGFDAAVELLAAGWTQSDGYNQTGLWKHAVWFDNFSFHTAADAVVYTKWLANHTTDQSTFSALTNAADLGKQQLDISDPTYISRVAHSPWPMRNLILGNIPEYLTYQRNLGLSYLNEFDSDGIRVYSHAPDEPDMAVTHWTNNANGFSATILYSALEAAELTGDEELTARAIAVLDKQTLLYSNSVPRGAQPWEIPLHTPDILASAYLVGCYVKGYELTGRIDLLEQAKYWAWTGIPFIYTKRSFAGDIGDYATIPVLGATQWVAPNWIGRPVQWCGLVYRNNLLRLSHYDSSFQWKEIANSITASGLQQTWPQSDSARQGLLPDFFVVEAQHIDGPAINPGTVQTGLAELYDKGSLYGFHHSKNLGWLLHAPSEINVISDTNGTIVFTTKTWGNIPYNVLLANVKEEPSEILSRNSDIPSYFLQAEYQYIAADNWLIITNVIGNTELQISNIPEPFSFGLATTGIAFIIYQLLFINRKRS